MPAKDQLKRVLSKILNYGFLLESDPKLPSVCSLVTGAPLRGSWWSHPLAQTIFQVNEKLEDHPDVLITKLISGKVTFVHRNLWPEIVAIGTSKEPWQMKGLSASATTLLKTIEEAGALRTDQFDGPSLHSTAKLGDLARDLERKLLVHAEQIHTASGAHAKVLETWDHWCERKGFVSSSLQPDEAKRNVEERLGKLNEEFDGSAKLPWVLRTAKERGQAHLPNHELTKVDC
jgi:hypothetical protein